jgi:hypothetical protein
MPATAPRAAPRFAGAERSWSRPILEETSSGSRASRVVNGSFGFRIVRAPSTVPTAPQVGATVDVATIIEVDLTTVRTILLTDQMAAYVTTFLVNDGVGSELGGSPEFDPAIAAQGRTYDHWREHEGPERARDLWILGQRVLKRAGTSNVQTLVTTKTKRARRMQYQRNP